LVNPWPWHQDGATTLFNSGTINNAAGTVTNVYGSILGEISVSSQGSFATISMTAGSTTGYLNLDLTNATILIDTAPVLNSIGAKTVLTFAASISGWRTSLWGLLVFLDLVCVKDILPNMGSHCLNKWTG